LGHPAHAFSLRIQEEFVRRHSINCDCRLVKCGVREPESCRYGSGLNPCGCCTICLQGPNEPCGGPQGINGKCGTGLTCVKSDPNDINSSGNCKAVINGK
ncbi:venom protein 302-like, partial [Hyalella azteca]|uniref:Venom protein 302-like n=1 Tax=Hyalella azteca TaxID=294128 RepID=A0A979FRN6_HYAAZ